MIASEATDGGTYPITHDEKVLNNIVVGCGTNITFWQGLMPGNALVNDLIAGNTLVEAHGTNLKFEAPYNASHQNTRICNNIILQTSGTSGYTSSTTGLTFDHNLWSKTPSSGCSGTGDVIADPLLVDAHHAIAPGQVAATWYGLTTSSPARGKGIALPDLTLDFFGNARSDPPDIGAQGVETDGGQLATITGLSSLAGRLGALVTISGRHFGVRRGAGVVRFGRAACGRYLRWTDRRIVVAVPAKAQPGPGRLVVRTKYGRSGPLRFTVKR
jgi:hypothetical protein